MWKICLFQYAVRKLVSALSEKKYAIPNRTSYFSSIRSEDMSEYKIVGV